MPFIRSFAPTHLRKGPHRRFPSNAPSGSLVTPLLWREVGAELAAGRLQAPAVRLVVEVRRTPWSSWQRTQ